MKKKPIIKKKMPRLRTDEEAEAFLMQDLRPYLHKGNFSKVKLVFVPETESEPQSENVNLRMSPSLLKTVKKRAKRIKMPYQRYMRRLISSAIANDLL